MSTPAMALHRELPTAAITPQELIARVLERFDELGAIRLPQGVNYASIGEVTKETVYGLTLSPDQAVQLLLALRPAGIAPPSVSDMFNHGGSSQGDWTAHDLNWITVAVAEHIRRTCPDLHEVSLTRRDEFFLEKRLDISGVKRLVLARLAARRQASWAASYGANDVVKAVHDVLMHEAEGIHPRLISELSLKMAANASGMEAYLLLKNAIAQLCKIDIAKAASEAPDLDVD